MRILTRNDCNDYIAAVYGESCDEIPFESYPLHSAFVLPADTGKKTGLGLDLAAAIAKEPPGLFWITGYGVWKSSENMDLFTGYRKSLGEIRSLSEAPGHLFDHSDVSSLGSLLSIALYFFWDASLVERSGESLVRVSHDEYVDFYSRAEERLQAFDRIAERLKMKKIENR